MMWWSLAVAAPGLTLVRDTTAVKDAVFLHLQVVPFEGRLFADPSGDPVPTPQMPDLDWDAVVDDAYRVARARLDTLGVRVLDGSAASWSTNPDDPLPMDFLPDVPDEARVAVVRVHLGWCPDGDSARLCVRSPDRVVGHGEPSVWAGIAQVRQRAKGPRWTRGGALYDLYEYAWLAPGVGGDSPVIGIGDSPESQAETALSLAVTATMDRLVTRKARRSVEASAE